jgi:membrane peptidoglycan carboxypeptidase
MTDVHGEPQQGGFLPAEIWHAYMSSVEESKTCVPFKASSESISYQPFYGKYATTGRGSSTEEGNEERSERAPKPAKPQTPGGTGAPAPAPAPAPAAPRNEPPGQRGGGGPGKGNGGGVTGGAGPG